ncbi:TadE/TadG family type IV pilus assembly protein [Thalassoglobus sp.]|uniref:TadE/TadG family type IV pilus assembly protein n=1 Tax=Thalassoglobus sp. TaxID=2795869 RepID=UPI003AA85BA6
MRILTTRKSEKARSGAVLVEFALVSSLFVIFLAMILEVSHVYLVINTLNASAKRAARFGVVEGVTSAQAIEKANSYLTASLSPAAATVSVLDGSIFDSPSYNADTFDSSTLTAVELSDLETRDLFVVRVTVPYDQVALIPPIWLDGLTLSGQSVMRHE